MGLRRVKEVKNNKSRKQRLVPGKPTWACQLAFTEVPSHRLLGLPQSLGDKQSIFLQVLAGTNGKFFGYPEFSQTDTLKGNGGHPRDAALSYFNVFPTFLSFPGGSVVKNPPSMQELWV